MAGAAACVCVTVWVTVWLLLPAAAHPLTSMTQANAAGTKHLLMA
jgi:hypothetical protein